MYIRKTRTVPRVSKRAKPKDARCLRNDDIQEKRVKEGWQQGAQWHEHEAKKEEGHSPNQTNIRCSLSVCFVVPFALQTPLCLAVAAVAAPAFELFKSI